MSSISQVYKMWIQMERIMAELLATTERERVEQVLTETNRNRKNVSPMGQTFKHIKTKH
jgi:hypothetical protein